MTWRLGFPLFNSLEAGLSSSATSGNADVAAFTNIGVTTSHTFTGLSLTECTSYYPLLRAKNSSDIVLDSYIVDPFIVDLNAPTAPASIAITENANLTRSASATWPAGTDNCSVSGYKYAIGTTSGGTEILNWLDVTSTTHQATSGVALQFGTSYYTSVRTVDVASQQSTSRTSSAWRLRSPAAYVTGTQTIASTDFNAGSSFVRWSTSTIDSDYFEHSILSNSETISVRVAGDYLVHLHMPFIVTSGCTTRCSVKASVVVNGSARDDGMANSSYVINAAGFTESSNHGVIYLRGLSAGDQIRIYTERGTSTVGTMVSEGVSAYIEYVYPTRSIFYGQSQQTVNNINFNDAIAADVSWSQVAASADFTYNVGSPGNITLATAGVYRVSLNLPMEATGGCVTRNNVRLEVRIDGVAVQGGVSNQGGIDCLNGHFTGSTHWFGVISGVTAGQVLTVRAQQEAGANVVEIEALKRGAIIVEKLSGIENFITLTGTRTVGSTNWNLAASPIQWNTQVATDATTFTHSAVTNNHQITINQSGNYILMFSDHLTSVTARTNVQVRVLKNGSNIAGAACNSNVITTTNANSESTCNMSVHLNNVTAGDVITLSAAREAAAATATAVTPARLTLLRVR